MANIHPTVPAEVVQADTAISVLNKQAEAELEKIKHLVIGRRVVRECITYRVTGVGLSLLGGHLDMTGVRVHKGKEGVRTFHIGYAILSEFLPD